MAIFMVNVDRANVQAFMREAGQITQRKVHFDKEFIKSLNLMDVCLDKAQELLGKDFDFLVDDQSFRLYVRDVFGRKKLGLFENAEGEYCLDIEHGLLLYYTLKSENSDLLNVALGLLYFLAGNQLEDELTKLAKLAFRNQITPLFELSPQNFRWRRAPQILRGYMLPFSVPEGYKAYYFEKPYLGHIMYLVNHGMSFEEAEEHVKSMEGGLFFTALPLDVENYLLPFFMQDKFNPSLMDGYYKATFERDYEEITSQYDLQEVYNVYSLMVKPLMIDYMGGVINLIREDLVKNDEFTNSDLIIYHLSPQRLGILVREWIDVNRLLPTVGKYFKPVKEFSLDDILTGVWL